MISKVKVKIERLLKAKFFRTAKYVTLLSNIIPIIKKNGKLRVYINFGNLNVATLKDEYPMSMAGMLVDSAIGNAILSFIDAYLGYNKIFIAKDDVSKITFRYSSSLGIYKWIVIPFRLKNARAIY